jgi:malate synthase
MISSPGKPCPAAAWTRKFWAGFAALATRLMPQNKALLAERDQGRDRRLAQGLPARHRRRAYTAFLKKRSAICSPKAGLPDRHQQCRS